MSTTIETEKPSLAQRIADWAQPVTAYLVLFCFGAALFLAYWFKDEDSIKGLVSAVQNLTAIIVGYYFGSSRGSQRKDDTLRALAAQPPSS